MYWGSPTSCSSRRRPGWVYLAFITTLPLKPREARRDSTRDLEVEESRVLLNDAMAILQCPKHAAAVTLAEPTHLRAECGDVMPVGRGFIDFTSPARDSWSDFVLTSEAAHYEEIAEDEFKRLTASQAWVAVEEGLLGAENMSDDSIFDRSAQVRTYQFLQPLSGLRCLQIGGRGTHAVRFAQAGAAESWLVTPFLAEARLAAALAEAAGCLDRFHAVVAPAEELPFVTSSFDRVMSGGSMHHTNTAQAAQEIHRVLRDGGRFAAYEPWRVPILYRLGTGLLGKREPGVRCVPLDAERVRPIKEVFGQVEVYRYGAFTRYLGLTLSKFGLHGFAMMVASLAKPHPSPTDQLTFRPGVMNRLFGSSVSIAAVKPTDT